MIGSTNSTVCHLNPHHVIMHCFCFANLYLTLCRLSRDINLKGTQDHTMYNPGREYWHHNTTCQH